MTVRVFDRSAALAGLAEKTFPFCLYLPKCSSEPHARRPLSVFPPFGPVRPHCRSNEGATLPVLRTRSYIRPFCFTVLCRPFYRHKPMTTSPCPSGPSGGRLYRPSYFLCRIEVSEPDGSPPRRCSAAPALQMQARALPCRARGFLPLSLLYIVYFFSTLFIRRAVYPPGGLSAGRVRSQKALLCRTVTLSSGQAFCRLKKFRSSPLLSSGNSFCPRIQILPHKKRKRTPYLNSRLYPTAPRRSEAIAFPYPETSRQEQFIARSLPAANAVRIRCTHRYL